ncbi:MULTISPECIES: type II toxin-antitoxin system RelE/ParE family toxin [unclassified Duganella]|uniref:type II toxin-antitoxin system RelE/ParE family toxin n=1 Tax=unclassified Duganella TaxID=2636909 RepID=UPI000B7D728F|nr:MULTISPECIES: type II toxin-antitoxin system RelE/ParE family toxin [unclassified Duganella]
MITSFKHKGLYGFYARRDRRGIPAVFSARIERIIERLDSSVCPEDMDLPGYKFHALKGKRLGIFSVHVSGNWRITFGFDQNDAIEVNLEDYH